MEHSSQTKHLNRLENPYLGTTIANVMLAFSAKWIQPILDGKKTVTFRKWPAARVKVGGIYDAATIAYPPKKFAKVEVTGIRRTKLGDIDDALAKRDGAASAKDVQAYWKKQGFESDKELWLVEFKVQKSAD